MSMDDNALGAEGYEAMVEKLDGEVMEVIERILEDGPDFGEIRERVYASGMSGESTSSWERDALHNFDRDETEFKITGSPSLIKTGERKDLVRITIKDDITSGSEERRLSQLTFLYRDFRTNTETIFTHDMGRIETQAEDCRDVSKLSNRETTLTLIRARNAFNQIFGDGLDI